MIRSIFWLTLAVVLAGCDRIDAIVTPVAEKVSRAFPLPPEIMAARESLFTAVPVGDEERRKIETRLGHLMTVRALTCVGAARIDRLDRPEEVRAKINDAECFKKHDKEIAEWIGVRRLAASLAQPALRPMQHLPAKAVIPGVPQMGGLVAAARAGVVVVKSNSGRYTLLDLAGGKPLNSFQAPSDAHRTPSFSPNGRVLAMPTLTRSLQVVEVESGSVLWATDRYTEVLAWLPDQQAVVLADAGGQAATLLDLRSGQADPYVPNEQRLSWTIEYPGDTAKRLVGSANSVSLVSHVRDKDGHLAFTTERNWRLATGGTRSKF